MAQYDGASACLVVRFERPAGFDRRAKNVEVVVADREHVNPARPIVGRDVAAAFAVGVERREGRERLRAVVICEIVNRRDEALVDLAPRVDVIEPDELPRMVIRQRLDENGVDRAEHRRGSADPDGEREHRDDREGGSLTQDAEREEGVVPRVAQPADAARVADLLLGTIETAEREDASASKVAWVGAGPPQMLRFHFYVETKLLVELALFASPRDERSNPFDGVGQEAHAPAGTTRAPSTAFTADAARCHEARSAASWRSPAGVSA